MRHEQVTGVVLAGGMARRMGGTDKGWVELEGKPLIQHAIAVLEPEVAHVLVNANRSLEAYRSLGFPVITDIQGDYQGPLMGMATGLKHATTPWVAFVPCDSPRLPANTVSRLVAAQAHSGQPIIVATDGKRIQPVVTLIRRDLYDHLLSALASGERKIDRWFAEVGFAEADFSDCVDAFVNVNRQDDLNALIAMPRLLGISAWSGTGKTTLLKKLIPALNEQGVRLAVIKHAHHKFDVDHPGKDSYELRKAGAHQMLIASDQRWALMVDKVEPQEPQLCDLISKLDLAQLDLVLVEGFKRESIPKLELHRPSLGKPLIYPEDENIIAIATDSPDHIITDLPVLDMADIEAVLAFVLNYMDWQCD